MTEQHPDPNEQSATPSAPESAGPEDATAATPDAAEARSPAVEWEPPEEEDGAPGAAPVKLWSSRDVGWVSVLLGFPAGVALVARNWYRLGRRRTAMVYLGGLIVAAMVAGFGPEILPGAWLALSLVLAFVLYRVARSQHATAEREERSIGPGGVGGGFAMIAGGWALWLVAAFLAVAIAAPTAIFGPDVPPGTVAFGTGGSECSVTGIATTFRSDQAVHLVSSFRREVAEGEVISIVLRDAVTRQRLDSGDTVVEFAAICMFGDLSAGDRPVGSYTLEYGVGSEVLATGELVITEP